MNMHVKCKAASKAVVSCKQGVYASCPQCRQHRMSAMLAVYCRFADCCCLQMASPKPCLPRRRKGESIRTHLHRHQAVMQRPGNQQSIARPPWATQAGLVTLPHTQGLLPRALLLRTLMPMALWQMGRSHLKSRQVSRSSGVKVCCSFAASCENSTHNHCFAADVRFVTVWLRHNHLMQNKRLL